MDNLMENIEDNFRNLVDNFEFPMSDSTQHLERNAQPMGLKDFSVLLYQLTRICSSKIREIVMSNCKAPPSNLKE